MSDPRAALDPAALADVAGPGGPWRRIEVVAETGSTNADLTARTDAGEDVDGTVLVADHQTAGRGRNGRTWTAVPGAQVSMSVAVATAGLPPAAWGWVPLVTGLAVLDAVAETTGVRAGLKWPNDVLAGPDARKLAGILAEVAGGGSVIVVGVGLNVSHDVDELPDPAAVSLRLLGAPEADRRELVAALLRQLARRIDDLRRHGGANAALVEEYVGRSLTVGARVRAVLPGDREVVGTARAIDDQGRLPIDTDAGTVVVSAGDIVHLRPV